MSKFPTRHRLPHARHLGTYAVTPYAFMPKIYLPYYWRNMA